MSGVRVLLVDDSASTRRLLTNALVAAPDVSVAAALPSGALALARLEELAPDVVVLDVEMPELDGVQTLREIRAQYPRLPVIMFSSRTERGAETTIRALAAGASDFVCKPSGLEGRSTERVILEELVPKLRALCPQKRAGALPNDGASVQREARQRRRHRGAAVDVLVIATSTGGPGALTKLLPMLPRDFQVPIAIVQHMPPIFTRYLAERLNGLGPLSVREAGDREVLGPGHVVIAPGDFHLALELENAAFVTRLSRTPPENSCRPAADVLFRSVAMASGSRVLAVVLTGMGQDGLDGARAISEAGGRVLAQDESSSVVWGMPGAVAQAGLAERVLPLERLAGEIWTRCAGRAPSFLEGAEI